VATERLSFILSLLAERRGAGIGGTPLCEVAASLTGTSGAGIMLLSNELSRGSFCNSDELASHIEELQFTLGEGPSIDAYASGRSEVVPDLARHTPPRWPNFTPLALESGIAAIFAFPIRIGSVRLGALNLYRDEPGALVFDEQSDALLLADIAARTILAVQAYAGPGELGDDMEIGSNFHFVVHQAAGMTSMQLDVSIQEALVRLRAHAYQTSRSIDDVARDVVARTLSLKESDDYESG